MAITINLFDIYRSVNIGIFLKSNDAFCLTPQGIPSSKVEKIEKMLNTKSLSVSIAGSRLIGPLAALNNRGIILSRLAEEEEVSLLRSLTGLNVERLTSRFTSVGNLICANDQGAVVSDVFGDESVKMIERVLEVPVRRIRIASYIQIGAMIATTNAGALVHPAASEDDASKIREALGFEPEPATVNGGVPFVSSGFVGNSKSILLGARTRGSELVIINRAFDG
ncbi:MAG: translation initiation factor IF-6 [Nitrososphaerales archaeon]